MATRTNKRHQRNAIAKYGPTIDPEELINTESFRKHNMRFLRERIVGISRKELASRLELSPVSIKEWEDPNMPHRAPTAKHLGQLSEELQCLPIDLYSDFRADHLAGILDDMLEMIITDFHQNIRSNHLGYKSLAMKQYEILCVARDYQENNKQDRLPDQDSIDKEVEMHKKRYTMPPDINETDTTNNDNDNEENQH